jgi:hypothetical protein
LNELFNDALKHLRLFWRLRNGTKISNAKFARCYLELFLGGSSYENLQENQVCGIFSGALLCHEHKMRATANNVFYAKKEWPDKARNVLYKV